MPKKPDTFIVVMQEADGFEVYECCLPFPESIPGRLRYREHGTKIYDAGSYDEAMIYARAQHPKFGVTVVE